MFSLSFVMPLTVCMITQDYSSQFVLKLPQPQLLFMGWIWEKEDLKRGKYSAATVEKARVKKVSILDNQQ